MQSDMGGKYSMGKIGYIYYDKVADYPKHPKKSESIIISEWNLKKYAILNGSFNGHVLSREGIDFYSSIYKMALDNGGSKYYLRNKDYEYAEASYKNSISFFLGMIATRIVALEKYDIIHMFHLKDKAIDYYPKGGKHPDWFGVDSKGTPFLFESKGTDGSRLSNTRMENARDQLNNISNITDKSGLGKSYSSSEIQRHVIVSCFRYDKRNKIKNRWYMQDVDPNDEGKVNISYNYLEEYFKYYKTFIATIDSLNLDYTCTKINGQEYKCVVLDGMRIGIHQSIYEAFEDVRRKIENVCDKDKEKMQDEAEKEVISEDGENFYRSVTETLETIKCKEKRIDNSSSFKDGIIVCSM